jgi:chromosome partitioning protein
MPVLAVINRKGGSGKSTLATHLAGYCATLGLRVMLGDVDRQQSSLAWLRRRALQPSVSTATIVGWAIEAKTAMRPPAGITHVVLDTPGGLRGFDLARVVIGADAILMPVCSSAFDRESAADCYAELMTLPRVASGRCKVALVGMRLDARTGAAAQLEAWAAQHKLPYIGALRETQAYVRSADQGLTLFDLPASKVQPDLKQWQPILEWVNAAWQAAERSTGTAKAAEAPRPAATAPHPKDAAIARTPFPAPRRQAPAVPESRLAIDPARRALRPTLADRVGRWLTVFRLSN